MAARYSNKSDEILTGSRAWKLKHNHISDREEWGEGGGGKPNFTSYIKKKNARIDAVFLLHERNHQIVFCFLFLGSGCNLSVRPLPFSAHFQTPLQPQSMRISHRSGEGGTGRVHASVAPTLLVCAVPELGSSPRRQIATPLFASG